MRPQRGWHDRGEVSRRDEDHDEEYHVKEDSDKMDDEDVQVEDNCDQADGHEEYRGEDRNAARRKTRRTAARTAAVRRTTRVKR